MSEASDMIARLAPQAISIAEKEEHIPIVMSWKNGLPLPPIGIKTASKEAMWDTLFASMRMWQPDAAVFINEGWAAKADVCPKYLLDACQEGRMRVSQLAREYRDETLLMYAEDAWGHWAFKQWVITERRPGGVTPAHEMSSDNETPERFETVMRGFVPVRFLPG